MFTILLKEAMHIECYVDLPMIMVTCMFKSMLIWMFTNVPFVKKKLWNLRLYMQKVVCDPKAKGNICIKGTCNLPTYGDNLVMDRIFALPQTHP